MHKKIILSSGLLLCCTLQALAQKEISQELVLTETQNHKTIFWEKSQKGKKLKLLDGKFKIINENYYKIGKFEKGLPIDTIRCILTEENILITEEVFNKQGQKHGRQLTFYNSNSPKSESTYIHGKMDGIYREWHENGIPKLVREMNVGIQDGPSTAWNEKGDILSEWHFKDGVRNGKSCTWVYAENGINMHEETYKNDQVTDTTRYYRIEDDGEKVLRSQMIYDKNNVLIKFESFEENVYMRIDYEAGEMRLINRYERGKLSARTAYKNNGLCEEYTYYYPASTNLWKKGKKENGKIVYEKEYAFDGTLLNSEGIDEEEN